MVQDLRAELTKSSMSIMYWPIRQLDVNNIFLNGVINETPYVESLLGFIDDKAPNHVLFTS